MQDRLSKLLAIFDSLDFSTNSAEGDDLLGDAYEYLMRHFATESGKSKGQFYTPAEVSRVMARVVGIDANTRQDQTIYDPTCGSGSLLLKTADEAPQGLSIYGQENDFATWALARMNMLLHRHPTAALWKGNTLSAPHFKKSNGKLETFDFAVANPPFSAKAWTNGLDPEHDRFHRFAQGIPPIRNGDFAFLLHLIKSLKTTGKGAIVLPHGVLSRGNKEAKIRRNLIKCGLIKGIIALPANLFYGAGTDACIIVIDKENASSRSEIFMIDASSGFRKERDKNRLREQDVHRIVDVFNRQVEEPHYARSVPIAEIASPANNYHLNISRYIDSSLPEDFHDLKAHLRGGIPNHDVDGLGRYWKVFPSLRAELFGGGDYGYAKVETQQVKHTILKHQEFGAFSQSVTTIFNEWRAAHTQMLKNLTEEGNPRSLIRALSEDLMKRCSALPLLDKYDVYQRLMDYWAGTMLDDVYLIGAEGWAAAARPRVIDNKIRESPDLTVERKKYKMDLLPPELIVVCYYASEQADVEALESHRETAEREREEFVDENSGEDGLLEEAMTNQGSLTKTSVRKLLKQMKGLESVDDRKLIIQYLKLIEAEATAGKAVKQAQAALDAKVLTKYAELTDAEIKTLVVDEKWFATIWAGLESELRHLAHALANRGEILKERYGMTLADLEHEVYGLREKVMGHLKHMGLVLP